MAQENNKNGKIKLQPYSVPDLAAIYSVCDRTFKKWIVPFKPEIGERRGRYYTIAQVRTIFDKLGLPSEISLEE